MFWLGSLDSNLLKLRLLDIGKLLRLGFIYWGLEAQILLDVDFFGAW